MSFQVFCQQPMPSFSYSPSGVFSPELTPTDILDDFDPLAIVDSVEYISGKGVYYTTGEFDYYASLLNFEFPMPPPFFCDHHEYPCNLEECNTATPPSDEPPLPREPVTEEPIIRVGDPLAEPLESAQTRASESSQTVAKPTSVRVSRIFLTESKI